MSNLWKASLQQPTQSGMTTALGLLNSGKLILRHTSDRDEEILIDGTAQPARNEETPRDRSGRPDNINSQEVARPQQFVIGNDEAALELNPDHS